MLVPKIFDFCFSLFHTISHSHLAPEKKNSLMDSISHNEIKSPVDTIDFPSLHSFPKRMNSENWESRISIKCRATNRMTSVEVHGFHECHLSSLDINSPLFLLFRSLRLQCEHHLTSIHLYFYKNWIISMDIYTCVFIAIKLNRSNWRTLNHFRVIETIMR